MKILISTLLNNEEILEHCNYGIGGIPQSDDNGILAEFS